MLFAHRTLRPCAYRLRSQPFSHRRCHSGPADSYYHSCIPKRLSIHRTTKEVRHRRSVFCRQSVSRIGRVPCLNPIPNRTLTTTRCKSSILPSPPCGRLFLTVAVRLFSTPKTLGGQSTTEVRQRSVHRGITLVLSAISYFPNVGLASLPYKF